MFHGSHYIGTDMLAHFEEGETWSKVFGPFFVYLNSTTDLSKAYKLWTDAKKQVNYEPKNNTNKLVHLFRMLFPVYLLIYLFCSQIYPRGCLKNRCGHIILSCRPIILLLKRGDQFWGDYSSKTGYNATSSPHLKYIVRIL